MLVGHRDSRALFLQVPPKGYPLSILIGGSQTTHDAYYGQPEYLLNKIGLNSCGPRTPEPHWVLDYKWCYFRCKFVGYCTLRKTVE